MQVRKCPGGFEGLLRCMCGTSCAIVALPCNLQQQQQQQQQPLDPLCFPLCEPFLKHCSRRKLRAEELEIEHFHVHGSEINGHQSWEVFESARPVCAELCSWIPAGPKAFLQPACGRPICRQRGLHGGKHSAKLNLMFTWSCSRKEHPCPCLLTHYNSGIRVIVVPSSCVVLWCSSEAVLLQCSGVTPPCLWMTRTTLRSEMSREFSRFHCTACGQYGRMSSLHCNSSR